MKAALVLRLSISFLLPLSFVRSSSVPPLLGAHPLDEKYFASKVIKCKDGSRVFTRDRLNDNFCDCVDGTDEPGTSACPAGKFYCRNLGSTPQFIFSSRVNDRFCDCCDGSDEYDGSTNCPHTCIMGGSVVYKSENGISRVSDLGSIYGETKNGISLDDLIEKLKGLKAVIILQVFLISCVVTFWIFRRRAARRKRRGYRWANPIRTTSIMHAGMNDYLMGAMDLRISKYICTVSINRLLHSWLQDSWLLCYGRSMGAMDLRIVKYFTQ